MMGCSGMALLVFVQHGQRDGYPMEVPKVAVVFLEKILQGFVLERVLLLPFYWVDNDTRDVDIGLGGVYPFITAIATQLSNYIGVNTSLVEAWNLLGVQYNLR